VRTTPNFCTGTNDAKRTYLNIVINFGTGIDKCLFCDKRCHMIRVKEGTNKLCVASEKIIVITAILN